VGLGEFDIICPNHYLLPERQSKTNLDHTAVVLWRIEPTENKISPPYGIEAAAGYFSSIRAVITT